MIRLRRIKRDAFNEGAQSVLNSVRETLGLEPTDQTVLTQLAWLVKPLHRTADPNGLDGTVIRPRIPIPMAALVSRSFRLDGWELRLIWYGADNDKTYCVANTFGYLPGDIHLEEFIVMTVRHALREVLEHALTDYAVQIAAVLLQKVQRR